MDAILHTNKGTGWVNRTTGEGESTRSQGWASGVAGLGGRGGEATRSQGWASGVADLGGMVVRNGDCMCGGGVCFLLSVNIVIVVNYKEFVL